MQHEFRPNVVTTRTFDQAERQQKRRIRMQQVGSIEDHHCYRRRKPTHVNIASYGLLVGEEECEREITIELLDELLMQSDNQVLNKYTRCFRNTKVEVLYQEFTTVYGFMWARWHMVLWIMVHIVTDILFVILPFSGFKKMDLFLYNSRVPLWVQYVYLPIAIPFALLPTTYNPFQRHWRSWICLVVIVFNFSFQIWMASASQSALSQFQDAISPSFRCTQDTISPSVVDHEEELSNLSSQQLNELTLQQLKTSFSITSVYAGALLQVLIAFSSLFSFIFVVSVRLEWLQALIVGVAAISTFIIVILFFDLKLEWMTTVCYVFAFVLLLILSFSSDGNNRRSFLAQLRVEKENASIQTILTQADAVLLNEPAREHEIKVVEGVLDTPEMRHLEIIRIRFTDIKLLQAIGRGGMGDVFKAKYFGTIVVCKRMRREQITESSIIQFREEIELMATLRHPNIVQFIGASWDNCSNVCIVMEYLENGDMHSVLHSNIGKRFTWTDPILKMAIDVAQGMLYLHAQEVPIVHRDLKSVNIFCSTTFGCKVGDFGLSRRYKKDIDALTTLVGTPFWLAPEIIRNERYGPAADIYSFGIVLTELETRQTPYYDLKERGLKLLMQIAHEKLRPSLSRTCSPQRRQLILDCLDDDPCQRPDFAEVLERLQNFVQQEIEENIVQSIRSSGSNTRRNCPVLQ